MTDTATAVQAPQVPQVPAMPRPSFANKFTSGERVGNPKSIALYGPTDTRKSSAFGKLAATPRFRKSLFMDADNGTEVFANDAETMRAVDEGRIEIFPIDTTTTSPTNVIGEVESTILELAGCWRTPYGHIEPNPNIPDFGYDLVVLDTVNLIQQAAVKHFLANTFSDNGKLDTRGAWGEVSRWSDEMIRLIHNSPRFMGGFIAHPKEVEQKTGGVKVTPALQGGFKDSFATIPTVVAFLDFEKNPTTNEIGLVATVGESDTHDSKNRYLLPSKLYNFDLLELMDIIDSKVARRPMPQTRMTLGAWPEASAPTNTAAPAATN